MALLPYKTDKNFFNRSRSSSVSAPIKKEIIHNEIYSFGESTLTRYYSCSQVFNKDEAGRMFETVQIQVMSFLTPPKNFCESSIQTTGRVGRNLLGDAEPVKESKIKDDYSNPQNSTLNEKSSKPQVNSNWMRILVKTIKCSFLLSTLVLLAAYIYLENYECQYNWNLGNISDELANNVFGQNEALDKVNSVLLLTKESKGLHVIFFTGGIGVGKSLTSSILSRALPWASNKLIVQFPVGIDFIKLLPDKFSKCGCNLIEVDDLSFSDVDEAVNLILTIKSRMKNENVLLLLIFSTHTDEEKNNVILAFKNSNFSVIHVPFKNLSKDVVKKCYQFEIQKQDVEISEIELEKLIDDKMKPVDVSKGFIGCKGVAEEVSYYVKKT